MFVCNLAQGQLITTKALQFCPWKPFCFYVRNCIYNLLLLSLGLIGLRDQVAHKHNGGTSLNLQILSRFMPFIILNWRRVVMIPRWLSTDKCALFSNCVCKVILTILGNWFLYLYVCFQERIHAVDFSTNAKMYMYQILFRFNGICVCQNNLKIRTTCYWYAFTLNLKHAINHVFSNIFVVNHLWRLAIYVNISVNIPPPPPPPTSRPLGRRWRLLRKQPRCNSMKWNQSQIHRQDNWKMMEK